jgi:hypothetical protein
MDFTLVIGTFLIIGSVAVILAIDAATGRDKNGK